MLPNTFVAGAQKGGTTTLCNALGAHPDVVMSSPKEPAFFAKAANLADSASYEKCFTAAPGAAPRVVVDGSNAYMMDPAVPQRIRDFLGGDLRFVFSLRDPVDRMISGYWHQAKKGRDRRTLSEVFAFESGGPAGAADEEQARLRDAISRGRVHTDSSSRYDDPLLDFRYFRNSLYSEDIARFRAVFGVDRVKAILFEDMVARPGAVLADVAAFLGLDTERLPADVDLHGNPTMLPRSATLLGALRRMPGRRLLTRMRGVRAMADALLYRRPAVTDPALKARLGRLVAPDVARLRSMLEIDLERAWRL